MTALNSLENCPSAQEGWSQSSLEELPCLSRGIDSREGVWQNPALLGKSLPATAHHPMALPDVLPRLAVHSSHLPTLLWGHTAVVLAPAATTTDMLGEL